jgi:CubicO group peptidase (beta-lactamase class C family)
MNNLDRKLEAVVHTPGAELSGLAVVIYAQGEIRYEGYFGHRFFDPDDPRRSLPVTAETRFRVASISKVVTTLAIMQLVERKLLDLDADVSDVLGWPLRNPHWPQAPITTRMLLTHTSSLRDGEVYTFPPVTPLSEVFQPHSDFYEADAHFAAPVADADLAPGRFFTYCNLGFGVMGTLVERLSGERFDQYVDRHVLAPLGVDASFNVRNLSDAGIRNLAALYRRQLGGAWDASGSWVAQVDDVRGVRPPAPAGLDAYPIGANGTIFSPQGGLRISARDLVEVMKLFLHSGQSHSGQSHGGQSHGGRGHGGRGRVEQVVQPVTIQHILSEQWRFDSTAVNGDPYGGLMRGWGLGLHHLTSAPADVFGASDRLPPGVFEPVWGHLGDAYGLLAAMLFDPRRDAGFIYIIGGVGCDPETYKGEYSAFYRWEEAIQRAILESLNEMGRALPALTS